MIIALQPDVQLTANQAVVYPKMSTIFSKIVRKQRLHACNFFFVLAQENKRLRNVLGLISEIVKKLFEAQPNFTLYYEN